MIQEIKSIDGNAKYKELMLRELFSVQAFVILL